MKRRRPLLCRLGIHDRKRVALTEHTDHGICRRCQIDLCSTVTTARPTDRL